MEKKPTNKFCIVCGVDIGIVHPRTLYCSRKCSSLVYRQKKGFKLSAGRYCKTCGKHFNLDFVNDKNRRYCSDDCARIGARDSRLKFYKKHPHIKEKYEKTRKRKHGTDTFIKRLRKKYPKLPTVCEACGENRVVEISHRHEFARKGAYKTIANCHPTKIRMLCPTCHVLLDKFNYTFDELKKT